MTPQPEGEAVTRADAGDTGDEAGAQARASVVAFWDLRSPTYDDSPGHATHSAAEHRAWLAALGALLPPAPADVLDVGAGTGFLALLLAELGHRVTGVDLASGMLAAARSKAARLPPRVPGRGSSWGTPSTRPCRRGAWTSWSAATCCGR